MLIGGTGTEPFTGTASEVADQLQDWFESGACDGFMMGTPIVPKGLEDIVNLLIPELQRRGLFHEDYKGGTLRDLITMAHLVDDTWSAMRTTGIDDVVGS